jgi:hypothetical protein
MYEELLNYLNTNLGSEIEKMQAHRYVLSDGTTRRIDLVRGLLQSYLTLKKGLDAVSIPKTILGFEERFKNSKKERITASENIVTALSQLQPAISVKDPKTCFLVDRSTMERSEIHIDFYTQAMAKKPNEVFLEAIYMDSIYNPRTLDTYYTIKVGGMEVVALNTYKKPAYFNSEAKPQIPTLFKDLIDHLIPSEKAKVYFYDWLYKSLTDRAYTFLVLCGMKGIGKGQLQKLIRALHGRDNFVEGKRGTIDGQFNSQLENSRLLWFDEIQYDKAEANNLKRIMNDLVSIERKGVDATRSTAIHCSIVLSNNDLTDNYIELDDRRFSPLELTEEKLTKKFNPKWFDEFNYHVDDLGEHSPLVAEFGKYILEYGKCDKIDRQEPYREEKFTQIVISSLRKWQDLTLEMLESDLEAILIDDQYTNYENLRKRYEFKHKDSGQYPKKNKVLEFLKAYESPETKNKVVEIIRVGSKERIIPIDMLDSYNTGFKEVKKMRLDV